MSAPKIPVPRLVDEPFPPYRYVPGGEAPHPFAHRGGWGFGRPRLVPGYHPPEHWRDSRAFLFGCDLFNRGWWWEAHETWEELWHVARPRSDAWDALLKGLIQLAASALQRERGLHPAAARLLASAHTWLTRAEGPGGRCCGLDLADLRRRAQAALGRDGPPDGSFSILPASD